MKEKYFRLYINEELVYKSRDIENILAHIRVALFHGIHGDQIKVIVEELQFGA